MGKTIEIAGREIEKLRKLRMKCIKKNVLRQFQGASEPNLTRRNSVNIEQNQNCPSFPTPTDKKETIKVFEMMLLQFFVYMCVLGDLLRKKIHNCRTWPKKERSQGWSHTNYPIPN